MDRSTQVRLAKQLGSLIADRSTDMAESVYVHPASHYTDPARMKRERELLFRKYPLVLGVAASIPEPGNFFTLNAGGTPLLVVRGDDGVIRVMLNICRHRANTVCRQASGTQRLFRCEYHSWSYDNRGRLMSFVDKDAFAELERGDFGLVELPSEIRHGLIWCLPDQDGKLDVAGYLGAELDAEFGGYGIEGYHLYRTATVSRRFNWKLGVDTFMEVFHVAHLHRDSVSSLVIGNTCVHEKFGRHHRLILPRRDLPKMVEAPEEEWDVMPNVSMVYSAFPNTCINWVMDHIEVFSFFPDPEHDNQCTVVGTVMIPQAPDSERKVKHWNKTWEIMERTIFSEDFDTMEAIQKNLESGATRDLVFGRNEISLQDYHRDIDRELTRDPANA